MRVAMLLSATLDPTHSALEALSALIAGAALIPVAVYGRSWVRQKYGPNAPSAYYGGVIGAWFFAGLLILGGIGGFAVQLTR